MYISLNLLGQGEFVQIRMPVDRVQFSKMEKFLQCFVNEDKTNERSKSFLCETCDVTDQRAGIGCNKNQTQESRPKADTSAQGQVREIVVSTGRKMDRNKMQLYPKCFEDLWDKSRLNDKIHRYRR